MINSLSQQIQSKVNELRAKQDELRLELRQLDNSIKALHNAQMVIEGKKLIESETLVEAKIENKPLKIKPIIGQSKSTKDAAEEIVNRIIEADLAEPFSLRDYTITPVTKVPSNVRKAVYLMLKDLGYKLQGRIWLPPNMVGI